MPAKRAPLAHHILDSINDYDKKEGFSARLTISCCPNKFNGAI